MLYNALKKFSPKAIEIATTVVGSLVVGGLGYLLSLSLEGDSEVIDGEAVDIIDGEVVESE